MAAPYAGEKFGNVGLDLLPPASAISALATAKLGVDEILVDGKHRGHPLHQREHGPAVRFACGAIRERGHRIAMITRRGGSGQRVANCCRDGQTIQPRPESLSLVLPVRS